MRDWSSPGLKYAEMAQDMIASRSKKDSSPVIKIAEHPKEWREWFEYYGFRKLYASQDLMRNGKEKTVPTLSPYDFDAEFRPGLVRYTWDDYKGA
jgi:hypothetical protein